MELVRFVKMIEEGGDSEVLVQSVLVEMGWQRGLDGWLALANIMQKASCKRASPMWDLFYVFQLGMELSHYDVIQIFSTFTY